jgi:hypothetical protein
MAIADIESLIKASPTTLASVAHLSGEILYSSVEILQPRLFILWLVIPVKIQPSRSRRITPSRKLSNAYRQSRTTTTSYYALPHIR